jgi:hypothetical protein
MSIECPIECVRSACPDPDWLEKHNGFVLTLVASFSAAVGVVLSYFLKSRCSTIDCCGMKCNREVVELNPDQVTVQRS